MPRRTPRNTLPFSRTNDQSGRDQDFDNAESDRVFAAAARAVARELGRQAAREYFAKLIKTSEASK
jgi:hypothetical protein